MICTEYTIKRCGAYINTVYGTKETLRLWIVDNVVPLKGEPGSFIDKDCSYLEAIEIAHERGFVITSKTHNTDEN